MSERCLIAVPMKNPLHSKSRLAPVLEPHRRIKLVHYLYNKKFLMCRQLAEHVEFQPLIVTDCPAITEHARNNGISAHLQLKPAGDDINAGLNLAVTEAFSVACANNFQMFCMLAADIVAPRVEEILSLLASPSDISICASSDRGTNALRLRIPNTFQFKFGPNSADAHAAEGKKRGMTVSFMQLESLSHDVDDAASLAFAMKKYRELWDVIL